MAGFFIRFRIEVHTKLRILPSLYAGYCIYKAVHKALGDDRRDKKVEDVTEGSLLVSLRCFTDKRFLEVFEDYKSGKIKTRLEKEFSDIGIETDGFVLRIENIDDVEEKAAAIKTGKTSPQIIVQGGAYKRLGSNIEESDFKEILKKSAKEGYDILIGGGTAVDAVEAAVRVLEDNEYFNAGYGSLLNNDGEVECDAMIMDGKTLNCGTVNSVRHFRNPVSLAKLIMNETFHCGLSGEGALKFAKEKEFPLISDTKQLITTCTRSKNYKVPYYDYGAYIKLCMRGMPMMLDVEDESCNTVSMDASEGRGNAAAVVAGDSSCDTESADAGEGSGDTESAVAGEGIGDTVSAVAGEGSGDTVSAVAGEGSGDTVSAVAGEGSGDTVSAVGGEGSGDAVSAVARDAYGHFACAMSTGGTPGKLKGRVSDVSMVGCGGYANEHGAATTSGLGESIMKITLAREVVYQMEGGRNAQDSAKESLEKMREQLNDPGGVIAIDQQGNFGKAFNTQVMGWASIKDRKLQFGLKQNECAEEHI